MPTIDVYRIALEGAGFDVEPILSGEETIRRIKEIEKEEAKKPDLILLDLILPDINGIEVLKEIRKHKKTEDISVFILTNYTDKELEAKGLLLKNEKYLLKTDYPPSKLVELVRRELVLELQDICNT